MSEILMELRQVSKDYRTGGYPGRGGVFHSLKNVDLTIKKGKTTALVGESGAGKTTTTRIVLMLEQPTEGIVLYEGRDTRSLSSFERKSFHRGVQAVFQDPYSSFDPRQNIYRILEEPLLSDKSRKAEERSEKIREMMERVGLDREYLKRYPHEFSGGQLQRIAIARALISDPKMLVLDEPVSALDVSIRGQILNLLRDLQKERGISCLYISHDMSSVRYLADEVAVICEGRIVEEGTADQVLLNPRHPYTRRLLAASTMTTLPTVPFGRVTGEKESRGYVEKWREIAV